MQLVDSRRFTIVKKTQKDIKMNYIPKIFDIFVFVFLKGFAMNCSYINITTTSTHPHDIILYGVGMHSVLEHATHTHTHTHTHTQYTASYVSRVCANISQKLSLPHHAFWHGAVFYCAISTLRL
jgi:hypothetical protein